MRISAALLVVSLLSIAWSYKQPLLGPIAALNRQRYLVSTASAAQLYRPASALHAKKRTNITKKLREPNFADKEEEEELELEEEKRDDAVQEPIVSAYESDVRIQIGSSIRDSAETREAPPQSTATRTTPPSSKQRVPSSSTMGIFADLEKDLESFDKRSKLVDYQSNVARIDEKNKAENNSIANKAKNVFSTILIADFFVVLVFLVWFLAAAALQSTYPVVLERFQDIFQPVVVPSLTVLMVGSIASGVLDKSEGRT
jgi:hypothetical protein